MIRLFHKRKHPDVYNLPGLFIYIKILLYIYISGKIYSINQEQINIILFD